MSRLLSLAAGLMAMSLTAPALAACPTKDILATGVLVHWSDGSIYSYKNSFGKVAWSVFDDSDALQNDQALVTVSLENGMLPMQVSGVAHFLNGRGEGEIAIQYLDEPPELGVSYAEVPAMLIQTDSGRETPTSIRVKEEYGSGLYWEEFDCNLSAHAVIMGSLVTIGDLEGYYAVIPELGFAIRGKPGEEMFKFEGSDVKLTKISVQK